MSKRELFSGVGTALVTPFRDGAIDYGALEGLIEWQIGEGVDALVLVGTTGEACVVSEEEHREILRFAMKQIAHRVPLIAGTGSNNIDRAVRLSKYASDVGCDGLLIVTPYYNKGSREGRYQSYRKIAENSDAPLIVYNVPSRCGVALDMEDYRRLAEIEGIAAVKEASGNMTFVCSLIAELGERFYIYSGNDELALPTIAVGGSGVISVVSNILPHTMAVMCHDALEGRMREARACHEGLLPMIDALFCEVNPIPVKYALSRMGYCACEYRLPLCRPDDDKKGRIDKVLKEYRLI